MCEVQGNIQVQGPFRFHQFGVMPKALRHLLGGTFRLAQSEKAVGSRWKPNTRYARHTNESQVLCYDFDTRDSWRCFYPYSSDSSRFTFRPTPPLHRHM